MSVPAAKKAAETVAKTVIPAASRAVTRAEASTIAPSATSTSTETSMPWEGWFSSFVADKIGQSRFEKIRSMIVYRPDDIHSLEQVPRPNTQVPLTDDGSERAMFRYPSPGSQTNPVIPKLDLDKDPFDVAYYKRDTARRYKDPAFPNPEVEAVKLALLPDEDKIVMEEKETFALGAESSPGNKGMFATGKSDFDSTGLRATMSTNHEALQASLDAHEPDHVSEYTFVFFWSAFLSLYIFTTVWCILQILQLPMPTWWDNQEELAAWYEENDLPVPMGNPEFGQIPREGRIARW